MDEKQKKKLAGIVPDLDSGEEILAAVRVTPAAELKRAIGAAAGAVAFGVLGFMAASAVAGRVAEERREEAEALRTAGKGASMVLVLTDRRLLLYGLGLTGKPKQQVGSLPRTDIADLSEGEVRIVGQRMPAIQVTTTSGESVSFGVGKIHRSRLTALLEAYHRTAEAS